MSRLGDIWGGGAGVPACVATHGEGAGAGALTDLLLEKRGEGAALAICQYQLWCATCLLIEFEVASLLRSNKADACAAAEGSKCLNEIMFGINCTSRSDTVVNRRPYTNVRPCSIQSPFKVSLSAEISDQPSFEEGTGTPMLVLSSKSLQLSRSNSEFCEY